MAGKARFGRSVLSARLNKDTKLDVTKRSMQTNLASRDAAGTTIYARYNAMSKATGPDGEDAMAESAPWSARGPSGRLSERLAGAWRSLRRRMLWRG